MSEYRRLDFSKLVFSDTVISYEEALEKVTPLKVSNEIISDDKKIKITKAEKDYKGKCVKLGTSY